VAQRARFEDALRAREGHAQGQEAPIAIYSMTTSRPEDAPHGMEFLYSLNRLNVATSRARCAAVLVAAPRLFEPECRTPRQMQLANMRVDAGPGRRHRSPSPRAEYGAADRSEEQRGRPE
jgi:hypothetical protein